MTLMLQKPLSVNETVLILSKSPTKAFFSFFTDSFKLVFCGRCKGASCQMVGEKGIENQVAHQAEAYPAFCSMKQLL